MVQQVCGWASKKKKHELSTKSSQEPVVCAKYGFLIPLIGVTGHKKNVTHLYGYFIGGELHW